MTQLAYAAKHNNNDIRLSSRSGGAFTGFTDYILENGGTVYGCILDDSFKAVHSRASSKTERDKMLGSKYVQSEIGNTFKQCADDLKNDGLVLFSGTPCQINGLKNYLALNKINTDKLITVDILCHGVPSPLLWKSYFEYVSKNNKVISVDFRDKSYDGWRDHVESVTFPSKKYYSRKYSEIFYKHVSLRPSCFECPYKNFNRQGDISLGDFWGIEHLDKSFDDNKGVSLILINSDKGLSIFNEIKSSFEIREYPAASAMQPALKQNYKAPDNRSLFWEDFHNMPVDKLVSKWGKEGKIKILKRFVKKMLRRA